MTPARSVVVVVAIMVVAVPVGAASTSPGIGGPTGTAADPGPATARALDEPPGVESARDDVRAQVGAETTVAWNRTVGGTVSGRPAVANGTVYAAGDATLHALTAATGSPSWNRTLDGNVTGGPALAPDGSRVYVGTANGTLYAVNATDGTIAWSVGVGGEIATSPAVDGSRVYVGTTNATLVAVDDATAATAWTVETTASLSTSTPAVGPDGTVYVGDADGALYAVTAAGSTAWNATVAAGVSVRSPTVSDGRVYVTAADGTVAAYEAGTAGASVVWNASLPGSTGAGPVSDGFIVVAGSDDGTIVGFDPDTGESRWTTNVPATGTRGLRLTAATDGVLVGSDDGTVSGVSTGGLVLTNATVGADRTAASAPGVGTGRTGVVGTTAGQVVAVDGLASPAPRVDVTVEGAALTRGETATLNVTLSNLTTGLSGFNLTVTADSSVVAVRNASVSPAFPLNRSRVDTAAGTATVSGVDLDETVDATEGTVTVATVDVEALELGTTGLGVAVTRLEDDYGQNVTGPRTGGEVRVSRPVVETNATVRAEPATELAVGETATLPVVLTRTTDAGVAGYNLTVTVANASVLNVTGASVNASNGFDATGTGTPTVVRGPTATTVRVNATDVTNATVAGETNVSLASIEVEALTAGSTAVGVSVDRLLGDTDVLVNATGEPVTQTVAAPEPNVTVSNLSVDPTAVFTDEQVTVAVDVANDGAGAGAYTVNFTRNGSVVETRTGSLAAGASTTVTFTTNLSTPGNYTLGVAGVGAETVTVSARPAPDVTVSNLSVDPTAVSTGEDVSVSVDVTNTGTAAGTYTVNVTLNGTVVATRTGTVDAGTTTTVTYVTSFSTPGNYTVGVAGVGTRTVTVGDGSDPLGERLFPNGVPASSTGAPPTDIDGDGKLEDIDGNGVFQFVDIIEFVFSQQRGNYAGLTAQQTAALDFDDNGRVTFVDVIDLVFELQGQ